MKKAILVLTLFTLTLLAGAMPARAISSDGKTWGVGLQAVPGIDGGVAVTKDINYRVSLQGVLGLGRFPTVLGRARYAFLTKQWVDLYGYGAVGIDDGTELTAGAGAGVEWDWRNLSPDLPPVSFNLEVGVSNWWAGLGFGVYYRF